MAVTNHELIAEYITHLYVERNLSEHTIDAYRRDLFQLAEVLELRHQQMFAAEPADIAAWLEHLTKHQIDAASRARKLSAARRFYAWLIRNERLEKDPTRLTVTIKQGKVLPKFIDVEVVQALLERAAKAVEADTANAIALRNYALLMVLYGGGVRIAELCGLREQDVKPKAGTVLVRGKGNKERIVPIGAPAMAAVLVYQKHGRPQHAKDGKVRALFLSERGTALSIDSAYRTVVRSTAEEHVHPHRFRHSCATHMLAAGADLRLVQEQLGHRTIATTQRYTGVVTTQLQDAHRKFHPLG